MGYAWDFDQRFHGGYLLREVAHADFVAAVADAHAARVVGEQVVYAGVVRRDVTAAHIAKLALIGEAAALDCDYNRRVQIRYKTLGELFALCVVGDWELHHLRRCALCAFHHRQAVLIGYIDHIVAQLFQRAADGDCAGRAVRFHQAGV